MLNHDKSVSEFSLNENLYRLKIIAAVGGIVNLIVSIISLFDQYAPIFIRGEIYLRGIWIVLSIIYFVIARRLVNKNSYTVLFIFYFTIGASLLLAALISALPFADHSYVLVFLTNILLMGTLLCLSDYEMLLVSLPSIVTLAILYLLLPTGILHKESHLTNVVSVTFFAFMMAHLNYGSKKAQFQYLKIIESKNEKLHRLSSQDELTGVANRRKINETLDILFQKSVAQRTALGVLMIDIDYFKRYNDSFGHIKGDECLIEITAILKGQLEKPTDFLGRFGGEEFLVLLPNRSAMDLELLAKKICEAVSKNNIPHPDSPYEAVTLSIGGVSGNPMISISPRELLEKADQALYNAKSHGRNRAFILKEISE